MGSLTIQFVGFVIFCKYVTSIYTTPPTWVTSNLVRAGNQNVIASITGKNSTPTYTFTFSSNLSGIPNLGYGIKAYEGYDYIGEQKFQVNRTYLDASSFTVAVQILGVTNILIMNVPYIAIDPTFPHHLNSFDNVPINYSAGAIVNISISSTTVQNYENIINYTQQAGSLTYKTFLEPLNRNKVLLFMTSLFIMVFNQKNTTPVRPINFTVNSQVISLDQYKLSAELSINANITKLHFSIIVFDQTDVMSLKKYMLVYQKVELPYTGGFIPVPAQFIDNFIMGFLDFSTNKSQVILNFHWNFQIVSGVHGVFMPQSVGQTNLTYGTQTINRVTYTLFYLKTWICPLTPVQTFFDPSQNLCTGCPIINCLDCQNITVCTLCDELNNFFLNTTTMQCSLCPQPGCLDCLNFTICQLCNTASNYTIINGVCQYCNYSQNIFLNTSNQCQLCTIQNCIQCANLSSCQTCNLSNNYYLPPLSSICVYCNNSLNIFIDNLTGQCQACTLANCLICSSLTSCATCNIFGGYYLLTNFTCAYCNNSMNMFINSSNQCEICTLSNCLQCSNLTSCQVCNTSNNYYLPPLSSTCVYCNNSINMFISSGQCQTCNLAECVICSSLTTCTTCNITNGYYLLPNLTCAYCNNLSNMFINSPNQCQTCSLTGCLQCSSLTSCQVCNINNNYYLPSMNNTCSYCNSSLNNFINITSGQCQVCNLTGCLICTDLNSCQICDINIGYYLPNLSSTCLYCNSTLNMFISTGNQCIGCQLVGCLDCLNLTQCQTCDNTNQYYLVGFICVHCSNIGNCSSINNITNNSTIPNNTNTTNSTNSTNITENNSTNITNSTIINNQTYNSTNNSSNNDTNSTFSNNTNLANDTNQAFMANQTYFNNDTNFTNLINGTNLTNGTNGTFNNDTVSNKTNGTSIAINGTNINNGTNYTNGTGGLTDTNSTNTTNTTNNTILPANNSTNTSNITNTTQNSTNIITNFTVSVCGNGILQTGEQCDDGNIISSDGCSNLCQLQFPYQCGIFCTSTFFIIEDSFHIKKSDCNKFQIIFQTNSIDFLRSIQQAYFTNNGLTIINRQVSNDNVYVLVEYNRDIYNETLQLFIPSSSLSLKVVPNVGVPLLKYQDSQCKSFDLIKNIVSGIQIMGYITLLISLLSGKIVGLELFGVLQLAYFSLAQLDFQNIYLSPLTAFKIFNGLNIPFFFQNSSVLPSNIRTLDFSTSFINNCNIMLILLFLQLLISTILYIISKLSQSQKLNKLSLKLFKQGFITLVMFNIFNISFSIGIHIKYFNSSDPTHILNAMIIICTLLAVIGTIICFLFVSEIQYGEFKLKFKDNCVCRSYIMVSIVYRMILGFFIALKNDYSQATLLILAVSFIFILFNITNLPFIKTLHNYRCNIIHITQLVILFSANYYRSMKLNTPMQLKGHMHTPAILQIIMILICLIISFLSALYEGGRIIGQALKKNRVKNKQIFSHQNSTISALTNEQVNQF